MFQFYTRNLEYDGGGGGGLSDYSYDPFYGLEEFLQSIDAIISSETFRGCSIPLFRGHAVDSYELLPTLHRIASDLKIDPWILENTLYYKFSTLVGPRIKFENSWDELYAMRHEGIPTRLLDWTENLGTALFFALDAAHLNNPCIWILNPFKLNEKQKEIGHFLVTPEQDLPNYHHMYACHIKTHSVIHELPLAIYPKRTNERILAQLGLFTLHGMSEKPLEDSCADCLRRVMIPHKLARPLKKLLLRFGINKYSVYPDFKGLAAFINEKIDYWGDVRS